MIILYNLANALQVDREWFRDYAYLNRDHQKAVSYIDEQKVAETRNDGDDYNTTDSLSSREKEVLALFRKVEEDERQALLHLLQDGPLSETLIFRGVIYDSHHTLYKIMNQIKDRDEKFLQKMLDYIVAMVFIETHDQKSPLRDLLTNLLNIQ